MTQFFHIPDQHFAVTGIANLYLRPLNINRFLMKIQWSKYGQTESTQVQRRMLIIKLIIIQLNYNPNQYQAQISIKQKGQFDPLNTKDDCNCF